jgi:glycosyltransferase involved in cell wall biosynthesis
MTDRLGPPQLAVVLSGWPRVSEVFAINEVMSLQRAGMLARVFATKHGEEGEQQPEAMELDALVSFLPDGDVDAQADAVVQQLDGAAVAGIHGYFAHQPAAVAAAAAQRLGIPYSFSVHALDARKVAGPVLADRARDAAAVICCNPDVAIDVRAAHREPHLVSHGVDLTRFPASTPSSADVLRLLAVGRLVDKKGFDVLLEAMTMVDRPCLLRIVGTGSLLPRLQAMIEDLGLGDRVELVGRSTHNTLPAEYVAADVVVTPSVVDSQGDRDGLPNVVLEAMASARPVVASDVAAISTAVRDGVTGTLVRPGDSRELGRALRELADDPSRRRSMGAAGRRVVEADFDLRDCTAAFCRTLEQVYSQVPAEHVYG